MGYRDETEAQRDRIVRLEHDLAIATAERDEVVRELESARVRSKRLVDLEAENAVLRAGSLPALRRARRTTVLVATVGAAGLAAMLLESRADRDAARETTELLHDSLEEERARRIAAESVVPLRTPRPITGLPTLTTGEDEGLLPVELFEEPVPDAIRRFEEARITHTEGRTDRIVGQACVVTLTHDGGPVCRVDVRCDDTDVYPGEGHAGLVRCHVGEGTDFSATDVHTSDVSGDPRLTLDGAAGTLEISDGSAGRVVWGITIALREAS